MGFEIGLLSRTSRHIEKGNTCHIKIKIGSWLKYIPLWFELIQPEIYDIHLLKQKEYSFLLDYRLSLIILTWGNRKNYHKNQTWMLETRNYVWNIPWKHYVLRNVEHLNLNYDVVASVRFGSKPHPWQIPEQQVLKVLVLNTDQTEMICDITVYRTVSVLKSPIFRKLPFIKPSVKNTRLYVSMCKTDTDKSYGKHFFIRTDESITPLAAFIDYCLTTDQGDGQYIKFLRVV